MGRYEEMSYYYKGEFMTVSQLMKFSRGVSRQQLVSRLKDGWDIDVALKTLPHDSDLDPKWHGKDLLIVFRKPISGVYEKMQPILNKPYTAIHNTPYKKASARHFFKISLENGKPLIVYPRDFEVLGVAEPTTTSEGAAPA